MRLAARRGAPVPCGHDSMACDHSPRRLRPPVTRHQWPPVYPYFGPGEPRITIRPVGRGTPPAGSSLTGTPLKASCGSAYVAWTSTLESGAGVNVPALFFSVGVSSQIWYVVPAGTGGMRWA